MNIDLQKDFTISEILFSVAPLVKKRITKYYNQEIIDIKLISRNNGLTIFMVKTNNLLYNENVEFKKFNKDDKYSLEYKLNNVFKQLLFIVKVKFDSTRGSQNHNNILTNNAIIDSIVPLSKLGTAIEYDLNFKSIMVDMFWNHTKDCETNEKEVS